LDHNRLNQWGRWKSMAEKKKRTKEQTKKHIGWNNLRGLWVVNKKKKVNKNIIFTKDNSFQKEVVN
tara:strand:- start:299 stop:496 length:198 start_codon:yes stop_codon:yes gene_type:complete